MTGFLLINTPTHSQEIIQEEYHIYPYSWANPLLSLKDTTLWKPKFKEGVSIIEEGTKSYHKMMRFRIKCYQLANNLRSDDPKVLDLQSKLEEYIKNYNTIRTLRYRLDQSVNKAEGLELTESKRTAMQKLQDRNNELDAEFKRCECPNGFSNIRGTLKYDKGYLIFTPFKYPILDSNTSQVIQELRSPDSKGNERIASLESINRIKNYLNGYDGKEKLGFELNGDKLTYFKNKAWTFGALTIPLKIYLDRKESSIPDGTNNIVVDANVSLFVGRQWGWHGFDSKGEVKSRRFSSINFLLGAGRVTLGDGNTTSNPLDMDLSILTVNTGLAYSFVFNKFNVFAAAGFDIPTTSEGRRWIFDKKPWLGIGLGYSVFKD